MNEREAGKIAHRFLVGCFSEEVLNIEAERNRAREVAEALDVSERLLLQFLYLITIDRTPGELTTERENEIALLYVIHLTREHMPRLSYESVAGEVQRVTRLANVHETTAMKFVYYLVMRIMNEYTWIIELESECL